MKTVAQPWRVRLIRPRIIPLEAPGLSLLARSLTGIHVGRIGVGTALITPVSTVNALLWPYLSRPTLPHIVFTLGFAAPALNRRHPQLKQLPQSRQRPWQLQGHEGEPC